MSFVLLYPWKIAARYADGFETEVSGFSEIDCMEKIAALQDHHEECIWYSVVTDEYYIDGELRREVE